MVHFNKSKKQLFVISLICGALFFAGCFSSSENPGLMVINVLEKNYFDDCHITGSIHIPFEDIAEKLKTLDKQGQYVVYCSDYACTTSTFVVQNFLDAGFVNVYDYEDGMSGWYQEELPYEGPAQKLYLQNKSVKFDDDASDVPVITTQDLYSKMKEFNLL